ncbi:peptidoglycan DD-metalloendopeptidase family protein [Actinomadura logoneensis]|nr:peptidoglycan DD-metalloendopeptidase family protein [Actinomadura logoneensis]
MSGGSGTAVVQAPRVEGAYPEGHLFLARQKHGVWRVALDSDADFGVLADTAPMMSAAERRTFGTSAVGLASGNQLTAASDYRTGMRLPFALGQDWILRGGPHGFAGTDTPYTAIDLKGGDQRVLAAAAGTAYTICSSGKGWVRVYHAPLYSGGPRLATDYYHLVGNPAFNGQHVDEGAFLGNTGTDTSCGGEASSRHVHFSLGTYGTSPNPPSDRTKIAIAGHAFGGWVIRSGATAYEGYALHGSARCTANGDGGATCMHNYGKLALDQGIVDANGGSSVTRRTGPGDGYASAGTAADGGTVTVSCTGTGTSHTGRWGTTTLWDRLSDGTWMPDAFLYTGVNGPIKPAC